MTLTEPAETAAVAGGGGIMPGGTTTPEVARPRGTDPSGRRRAERSTRRPDGVADADGRRGHEPA